MGWSAGHVTVAFNNFHFGGLTESPISLDEAGNKIDCFIFILAGSIDDVTFGGVHNVGNVVIWKRFAVNIVNYCWAVCDFDFGGFDFSVGGLHFVPFRLVVCVSVCAYNIPKS